MGRDILNNRQQNQPDPNDLAQREHRLRAYKDPESGTWIPTIDPDHTSVLRSIQIELQPVDLLYRPATLTGLIKIHKNPIKFRPVIDMSDTIAALINQRALSVLQDINNKNKKFAVLNSIQTVDIIR